MIGRVGLAVAVLALQAGAAWAGCTPAISDLDAFGIGLLGPAEPADLDAKAMRTPDCHYQTDATCTYLGREGIEYDVVEGTLWRKAVALERLRGKLELPYGITTEDQVGIVVRKLKDQTAYLNLRKDAAGWRLESAGYCLLNGGGAAFSASFVFDQNGRFVSFATEIQNPRD